MSPNLDYWVRERQRKRESRWQASKAPREKWRQRSRARDKKQRRHFFVGRTTWKFCSGGDKIRRAGGYQCKVKMGGSEKSEQEHVRHFLHKGEITRDDSQQRFLAQHNIKALLRHCFEWLQHCSNIATLCCAENRRSKSFRVTSPSNV